MFDNLEANSATSSESYSSVNELPSYQVTPRQAYKAPEPDMTSSTVDAIEDLEDVPFDVEESSNTDEDLEDPGF